LQKYLNQTNILLYRTRRITPKCVTSWWGAPPEYSAKETCMNIEAGVYYWNVVYKLGGLEFELQNINCSCSASN